MWSYSLGITTLRLWISTNRAELRQPGDIRSCLYRAKDVEHLKGRAVRQASLCAGKELRAQFVVCQSSWISASAIGAFCNRAAVFELNSDIRLRQRSLRIEIGIGSQRDDRKKLLNPRITNL